MADFDILKSMADLNNFIQRQQASMLQLYQFDYEQKKKEAKDKLVNKIVTEKKDPIVAAQEVDEEYQDYNFGNELLVTGVNVKKMIPANTFAEINRIDKDKTVYTADNGYATETDAYHNYKPLEYNYQLTHYKEKNNTIQNVQVSFSGEKGSYINNVWASISNNNGSPIVRINEKDGDEVKVHEFKNITQNSLKDGITKELQINNPYMTNKIVEGIGAGLEKINNAERPQGYYFRNPSGNPDVNIPNEDVSLPSTDGDDSSIDLTSNFNPLLLPLLSMDNAELTGFLTEYSFNLRKTIKGGKTKYWAEINQKGKINTQIIEKIKNAVLLGATHIFETQDPIIADIKKGDTVEPHYVLNIGKTEAEFVIANGVTKTKMKEGSNQVYVYRRVLGDSISNGMPIVIYYTGDGEKIENIVGARMYISEDEKSHIDKISNYMRSGNGNVDANFLNRFKKALTDFTIIGATAFATNKYIKSGYGVGDITLKNGAIELESEEALKKSRNHIALIAKYKPILAKKLFQIWDRSTKMNNMGN